MTTRGLGQEIGGRRVRPRGVIHVGGHHGEEASYYRANGVETVVWMEADPDAFAVLQGATAGHQGHHCIHALVADRDGVARTFYRHRFPGGTKRGFCSTLPWNRAVVEKDAVLSRLETFDVAQMQSVTVRTALRARGLAPDGFQYLSLNVQGAERLVLEGMGEYLGPIEWIYCDGEDGGGVRYEGAPSVDELAAWLAPHGFRPAFEGGRQQLFHRARAAAHAQNGGSPC